jgi:hypothetical protein
VGLAGVFVLGGCTGPAHPDPTPTTLAVHWLGPVTSVVDYPTFGLTLRPPRNRQPAVGWPRAYANCGATAAVCPDGFAPTIVLGDATSSTNNLLDATPVYLITYSGVPCIQRGFGFASSARPSPSPTVCMVFNVINANTGAFIESTEIPR